MERAVHYELGMTRYTALTAALVLSTRFAFAAEPQLPPPDAPHVAPTPAAPVGDVPVAGGCVLGSHPGTEDVDATTAAEMICSKLRNAAAPTDRGYRIKIRKLGRNTYLVAEAIQGDRVIDSRELQINGIEEAAVAAPRLAEALVGKKALEETETATNAVGGENQKVKKRNKGHVRAGIGIGGMFVPTANLGGAVGSVPIWYETDHFSLGGRIRLGLVDAGLFGGEVGGRYNFSSSETSPYLGAGLGMYGMWLNGGSKYDPITLQASTKVYSGAAFGVVPHLEAGISFLRSQTVGLDVSFRADMPTFAIDKTMPYVVPLSLSVELKF